MSKLDNFKKFVSSHPEFIDYVRNNNVSWQTFYELYDIYGENDDIWKKYIKSGVSESISIKGLLNTIKSINIDSLEENIGSIQKAVSLVEELTRKDTSSDEKKISKEEKVNNLYGEDK